MDISLEKLLEVGAHFGHQTKRWNPRMSDYVYGVRDGVYIFDLIKTREAMSQALAKISEASAEGKLILLIGTKKQAREKVAEVANKAGIPYVDERWLGGTLTNFEQIRDSVKTLQRLRTQMKEGKFADHTKKERLLIDRKIKKLERNVGGIEKLEKKPDLMIIIDIKRERAALLEGQMNKIDLVGVVDTNADPDDVDYPIPMNDDSPQALDYILELILAAITDAKKTKKKAKTVSKKPAKKAKPSKK